MAFNPEKSLTYTRYLVMKRLISAHTRANTTCALVCGQRVAGMSKLGDPNAGAFFGGKNLGIGKRAEILGSANHVIRRQSEQADESEGVGLDGDIPSATKFGDEMVDLAATHWSDFWVGMRVHKDRVDDAKGDTAIASVFEETVAMYLDQKLATKNKNLITGTLSASQQDEYTWTNNIGLIHAISDGVGAESAYAQYARKDRTVETYLKANVVAAATLVTNGVLANTVPTFEMFRAVRYITTYGAPALKIAGGAKCWGLPPDLWIVLANALDDKSSIYFSAGQPIPQYGIMTGMDQPSFMKDDMLFYIEQDLPAGTAIGLTLEEICYEVQKGNNWVVEPWVPKWKYEEASKKYYWSKIHCKDRLTLKDLRGFTKITGLTAVA